jgi:hypothetical protein
VDIEVKDSGMQAFFVAVSVCFDSRQDDELRDIASQLCPDNKTAIFAFVPAYSYGARILVFLLPKTNWAKFSSMVWLMRLLSRLVLSRRWLKRVRG